MWLMPRCLPSSRDDHDRHRHEGLLKFLKQVATAYPRRALHVVCDNYATHKHPDVEAWLAKANSQDASVTRH